MSQLSITIESKYRTGKVSRDFKRQMSIVQVTAKNVEGRKSLTTTPEQIPLDEVTTPRWSFFENLDVTNDLIVSRDSGGTHIILRLGPGQSCEVPVDSSALYAAAVAGTSELYYSIRAA